MLTGDAIPQTVYQLPATPKPAPKRLSTAFISQAMPPSARWSPQEADGAGDFKFRRASHARARSQ